MLSKRSIVVGDNSCMLEAVVRNMAAFGDPANGYPWATAEDLVGRTPFEAFVNCVQPGRGPLLKPAAVAAALLIATGQLNRKLACEHCQIPEGGRSRVGTLAKQIKQFCGSGVPELPDEWKAPERETPIEKKLPKPRRKVDKIKSMPVLLAKRYQREKTREISVLSPQKTRRVHALQYDSPGGGCSISTYAADASPFEEGKPARTQRLARNRARRCQAYKSLELSVFCREEAGEAEGLLWDVRGRKFDRSRTKRRSSRIENIAALPRERQEWLAKERRKFPRLLDYNPELLLELSLEGTQGSWQCSRCNAEVGQVATFSCSTCYRCKAPADRWEPNGVALALDFSEESLFLDGRWKWFCGEYGDGRNPNGEQQNIDIDMAYDY